MDSVAPEAKRPRYEGPTCPRGSETSASTCSSDAREVQRIHSGIPVRPEFRATNFGMESCPADGPAGPRSPPQLLESGIRQLLVGLQGRSDVMANGIRRGTGKSTAPVPGAAAAVNVDEQLQQLQGATGPASGVSLEALQQQLCAEEQALLAELRSLRRDYDARIASIVQPSGPVAPSKPVAGEAPMARPVNAPFLPAHTQHELASQPQHEPASQQQGYVARVQRNGQAAWPRAAPPGAGPSCANGAELTESSAVGPHRHVQFTLDRSRDLMGFAAPANVPPAPKPCLPLQACTGRVNPGPGAACVRSGAERSDAHADTHTVEKRADLGNQLLQLLLLQRGQQ